MKKKILIGVGLYLVAGVVTAAVLARPFPAISAKLEAVALWPAWIFNRMREGRQSSAGLSPVGAQVAAMSAKTQLTDSDRKWMRDNGIAWTE